MILAAAIGAVTSRVALFDSTGSRVLWVETVRTAEHDGVAALLARLLDGSPGGRVESACIGVTVAETIYAHELAEAFEIPSVAVVDGVEAHAYRLRDLARIAANGALEPV